MKRVGMFDEVEDSNGVAKDGMCERRVSDGGSVWKRYLRYLKSKQ